MREHVSTIFVVIAVIVIVMLGLYRCGESAQCQNAGGVYVQQMPWGYKCVKVEEIK